MSSRGDPECCFGRAVVYGFDSTDQWSTWIRYAHYIALQDG
jgi:hypothetical protein